MLFLNSCSEFPVSLVVLYEPSGKPSRQVGRFVTRREYIPVGSTARSRFGHPALSRHLCSCTSSLRPKVTKRRTCLEGSVHDPKCSGIRNSYLDKTSVPSASLRPPRYFHQALQKMMAHRISSMANRFSITIGRIRA